LVAILAIGCGVALAKKAEVLQTPTNLSGWWSLDVAKSDTPGMGGPGGWGGRRRGGWGGSRPQGDAGGGRGGRPARLPSRIHITQDLGIVSIADSIGAPLEEILIGRKVEEPPAGMEDEKAVPRFAGAWNKGALEVERKGRRGTMKETITLEEGGRDLVIRTSIPARESRPAREFKRVYRRTNT
jgi:hypothetical protein